MLRASHLQRWASRPISRRSHRSYGHLTGRCEPRRASLGKPVAVSNHEEPAATTPRAAGSFVCRLNRRARLGFADGSQASSGVSARVLRRGGARGRDGRAGARAVRRPGVRAQADRPQPARRPRAGRARGDLRRGGDRGARGRHGRLLGARRRALGARERGCAAAEHDRRHVPARHEGARPGAARRGRRLHGDPDRPCRARGGGRHAGRGARGDRARRERRRRRAARVPGRGEAGLHHADHTVGRRDGRGDRGAARAVPVDLRAEERGHLLRDLQPPVGGEGDAR